MARYTQRTPITWLRYRGQHPHSGKTPTWGRVPSCSRSGLQAEGLFNQSPLRSRYDKEGRIIEQEDELATSTKEHRTKRLPGAGRRHHMLERGCPYSKERTLETGTAAGGRVRPVFSRGTSRGGCNWSWCLRTSDLASYAYFPRRTTTRVYLISRRSAVTLRETNLSKIPWRRGSRGPWFG